MIRPVSKSLCYQGDVKRKLIPRLQPNIQSQDPAYKEIRCKHRPQLTDHPLNETASIIFRCAHALLLNQSFTISNVQQEPVNSRQTSVPFSWSSFLGELWRTNFGDSACSVRSRRQIGLRVPSPDTFILLTVKNKWHPIMLVTYNSAVGHLEII